MIDNFALALSHGLIMLAAWRLLARDDLDRDDAPPGPRPRTAWFKPGPGKRNDA